MKSSSSSSEFTKASSSSTTVANETPGEAAPVYGRELPEAIEQEIGKFLGSQGMAQMAQTHRSAAYTFMPGFRLSHMNVNLDEEKERIRQLLLPLNGCNLKVDCELLPKISQDEKAPEVKSAAAPAASRPIIEIISGVIDEIIIQEISPKVLNRLFPHATRFMIEILVQQDKWDVLNKLNLEHLTIIGNDANLDGIEYAKKSLRGFKINLGYLQESNLQEVKAEHSVFSNCRMAGARLQGACFNHGILVRSHLTQAVGNDKTSFDYADLSSAKLISSFFGSASFLGTRLFRIETSDLTRLPAPYQWFITNRKPEFLHALDYSWRSTFKDLFGVSEEEASTITIPELEEVLWNSSRQRDDRDLRRAQIEVFVCHHCDVPEIFKLYEGLKNRGLRFSYEAEQIIVSAGPKRAQKLQKANEEKEEAKAANEAKAQEARNWFIESKAQSVARAVGANSSSSAILSSGLSYSSSNGAVSFSSSAPPANYPGSTVIPVISLDAHQQRAERLRTAFFTYKIPEGKQALIKVLEAYKKNRLLKEEYAPSIPCITLFSISKTDKIAVVDRLIYSLQTGTKVRLSSEDSAALWQWCSKLGGIARANKELIMACCEQEEPRSVLRGRRRRGYTQ